MAQSASNTDIGGGRLVQMGRATWDTGWFQAEIYRHLLRELGYHVERPRTFDNVEFYQSVAAGEVDFWVNGWFPLHSIFLTDDLIGNVEIVGTQVSEGAIQGYLIDKPSADQLEITSLTDFARPEVAQHFDRNGDGLADLVGCNVGWACGPIIDAHISTYALENSVEQIQGDYGPLALDTIERFRAGEPVFFYAWTPNWILDELTPGQETVWITVPSSATSADQAAADQASVEEETLITDVAGCVASPCPMGFQLNDIQAVANQEFLRLNPFIRALLEAVVIPLDDITAQNARLIDGEDEQTDIEHHAATWIEEHQAEAQGWLATAIAAYDEAVAKPMNAGEEDVNPVDASKPMPRIRLATKPLAPFVIYDVDAREYTGFSIELWKLIAEEANFEYEIHGVNTIAKLLDEVERGAADVAMAGIGITSQRERALDFSHAYFESGLQIMVASEARGLWGGSLLKLAGLIFSPQLIEVLGLLLVCLLVAAHVMWFSERHINEDFSVRYWPGIWEAFWWSAVTATTVGYGDKTPKTIPGRIVGLIWMFSGLFVLASFTASIATTFAVDEVNSHIVGPTDLLDKQIATIERSTAAEYLAQQGIRPILFSHEDDAYAALRANEVDAVVYDAPVLQHYVALDRGRTVKLVGLVFQEQQYGIAIAHDPILREQINLALLRLVESGEYDTLYRDWF